MMLSKDGTSIIGKIGFLLPLLILFIAADAAACPEHRSGPALRTKAVKINNGGHMRTTVIGYRAPATYRLCGNTLRDTRGVAYIRDGYRNGNGARYVAVRNGNSRAKYVPVRTVDRAPRYVAVRRASPDYIEDSGVRYVAVRNGDRYYTPSRTRTIVRGIDIGPEPRYVAVRQAPIYVDNGRRKYIAVRNVDRYNDVAVRDIDIDDEPRYVGLRNVDRYDGGTRYVAGRDRSDDFPGEIEEIALHDEPLERRHVVEYSDTAFSDNDDAAFISTNWAEDACLYPSAVRRSSMVETRMVSYVEDDDIDDHAFLRVRAAAPAVASYKPVSYSPVDDDVIAVDDSDVQNIATDSSMNTVSYIPVGDDVGVIDDGDISYVAEDENDQPCRMVTRTCSDDFDTDTISYVPVNDASLQAVSYVPVNEVANVSYVPVDDVERVSYVPLGNAIYSNVSEVDTVYCPMTVSSVNTAPDYVSDMSANPIEVREAGFDADYHETGRIARDYGFRDGFEDGADAGIERDTYHPDNSGDYQKATNGYEDDFGDKDVYRDFYRSAYLNGYRSGFNSIARSTAVG